MNVKIKMSHIWEHFSKCSDDSKLAKCNYCHKQYSHGGSNKPFKMSNLYKDVARLRKFLFLSSDSRLKSEFQH